MSEQPNKCPNCGATLKKDDNRLTCPYCDYNCENESSNQNLIDTLATAYVMKKMFSSSHYKAKRHVSRAIDEFYDSHYSDCRMHLNNALRIDPDNKDAILLKSMLTKGQNGRYIDPPSSKYVKAMKVWLKNEYYKSTEYMDSLFLSNIRGIYLDLLDIRDLIKYFEESSLENKNEFLEYLYRIRKVKKIIMWFIILLIIIASIAAAAAGVHKVKSEIKVYYYASEGGTVYIPKERTRYINYYIYSVNPGSVTYATAVPDQGYQFVEWSDGLKNAQRTDKLTSNYTVTAYFSPKTYTVKYSAGNGGYISGETSQSILPNKNGSTVTAIPNLGYKFSKWSDGETNATRRDMNISKTFYVTAYFESVFDGGDGTSNSPFLISNATNLVNMKNYCDTDTKYASAYYKMTKDIDMSEIANWTGIQNFTGNFNGNYHKITNLKINISSYSNNEIGLFTSTSNATIGYLSVSIEFSGKLKESFSELYCGGIVGKAYNTRIIHCSTYGSVNIFGQCIGYVGGIVGYMQGEENYIDSQCYSYITMNNLSENFYISHIGNIYGYKSS